MPMTPDQLSVLRGMIPDEDQVFGPEGNQYLFTDDQLNSRYNVQVRGTELAKLYRTAAMSCIAMAASDLAILKDVKSDKVATAGYRTSAEWRELAALHGAAADAEDSAADLDSDEAFDLIGGSSCNPDPFYATYERYPWG